MLADRVEVSWDSSKDQWLVRIQAGEYVVRRHCGAPKSADDQALENAVQQTIKDEGYEADPARIAIHR
jgi:hypothetical protein